MYIIPILFPGTISQQVKVFANNHLAGKLDYKKTHLSFFKHFPSLTVSVDDFILKGSKPYQEDTLLAAKEVAVGINLKNLIFNQEVKIDEIYVSDAYANIFVNSKGEANYNVYISKPNQNKKQFRRRRFRKTRLYQIKKLGHKIHRPFCKSFNRR